MFALAKLARVNRSTLHRLERGEQEPNPRTVRKLERVLERSVVHRGFLRDVVRDDEVTEYVTRTHPQGLSVEQVATVLNLSPRSVKNALASAIQKLVSPMHEVTPEGDAVRLWRARLREQVQQQCEREHGSPWPRGLDQVDDDEDERALDWWCGTYIGEEE